MGAKRLSKMRSRPSNQIFNSLVASRTGGPNKRSGRIPIPKESPAASPQSKSVRPKGREDKAKKGLGEIAVEYEARSAFKPDARAPQGVTGASNQAGAISGSCQERRTGELPVRRARRRAQLHSGPSLRP